VVGGARPDAGLAELERDTLIDTVRATMDRLRAALFDMVEVADLNAKQEKAAKGLVRKFTYDAQAELEAAVRER
jgi:hypothetical protein